MCVFLNIKYCTDVYFIQIDQYIEERIVILGMLSHLFLNLQIFLSFSPCSLPIFYLVSPPPSAHIFCVDGVVGRPDTCPLGTLPYTSCIQDLYHHYVICRCFLSACGLSFHSVRSQSESFWFLIKTHFKIWDTVSKTHHQTQGQTVLLCVFLEVSQCLYLYLVLHLDLWSWVNFCVKCGQFVAYGLPKT